MPALTTRMPAPTIISDDVDLPPKFPDLPNDLLQRFPSLNEWEEDTTSWYRRVYDAIQGNNRFVSQTVGAVAKIPGDLIVKVDGAIAAIQTETDARINADEILARRIVTVSAISGTASNIVIQNTAPVSPTANEIWIDNTSLLNPITYQWDGVQWVEVTEPITVAAVAAEQTARITADGFLSGKYSLTVIAGNVVTGMNITSSSGPGTNISSVIFRATDFQIYNGTSGITMFSVSGSNVNLAGVLTVSTSGKVFTGVGTYANSNTPFYVDSSSNFSLGSSLTWNGTTLTIVGSISATTGTIGGWTVGATTISANNAVLDSAGQLILGTGNDVVYLSATDATYRMWIGNVTAGSAAFAVSKTGAMFSSGATIVGAVTFASTNRVLATDNSSFLTWQGPAGANTAGFYTQQAAAGGGFSAYGAGSGSPLIGLYRSAGSYGSPSNLAANSIVGTVFVEGFVSGAYNETGRLQWGISATGNTPYMKIEVTDASSANIQNWIFNYDGKMYFTAANDVFSPSSALYAAPYVADPLANLYRSAAGTMKTDGAFVVAGNLTVSGTFSPGSISTGTISGTTITASSGFSGPGSSITSLNASNISSGTINNSRLPASISVTDLTLGGNIAVFGSGTNVYTGNISLARLFAGDGSASSPTVCFANETNTGIYRGTSGHIDFTVAGSQVFTVRAAAIVCLQPLKIDNARSAGSPTPGGTVTILDSTGATISLITT